MKAKYVVKDCKEDDVPEVRLSLSGDRHGNVFLGARLDERVYPILKITRHGKLFRYEGLHFGRFFSTDSECKIEMEN